MAIYAVYAGNSPSPLFEGDSADTNTGLRIESPIGTILSQMAYTGAFSANALIALSEGADQSIDTAGTIAADGKLVTLVHTSTAANKTGVIMHIPTVNVFKLIVNYSANSLTFAASGTSFVANGTGAIILAGTAVWMYYSVSKALWFMTNA